MQDTKWFPWCSVVAHEQKLEIKKSPAVYLWSTTYDSSSFCQAQRLHCHIHSRGLKKWTRRGWRMRVKENLFRLHSRCINWVECISRFFTNENWSSESPSTPLKLLTESNQKRNMLRILPKKQEGSHHWIRLWKVASIAVKHLTDGTLTNSGVTWEWTKNDQ